MKKAGRNKVWVRTYFLWGVSTWLLFIFLLFVNDLVDTGILRMSYMLIDKLFLDNIPRWWINIVDLFQTFLGLLSMDNLTIYGRVSWFLLYFTLVVDFCCICFICHSSNLSFSYSARRRIGENCKITSNLFDFYD